VTSPLAQPSEDQFDFALPPSPYPGLRPFDLREWPIFFGRERMTDEIVERLIAQQLVVLHGDSGCGKSSLIRAGALARLEQEHAREGLSWRTSAMRPANAPLQALAEALAALDGRTDEARVVEIRRVLNFGADAPEALVRLLGRGEADHICILFDQFEELFASARRPGGMEEATLLVRFLVSLVERQTPGLYAIVTMRSEFLGACAQFADLAEAVNRSQYLLPRMTNADLLRAIREPASLYCGQVSQALAERLLADGRGPDELPLIQHGLSVLYRRRMATLPGAHEVKDGGDDRPAVEWRLELSDYTGVEGLRKLLSDHADDVCRTCGQGSGPTIERMFRAITAINAEGQAIRRPQTFASIVAVTGAPEATVRGIIDAFRSDDVSLLSPYGSTPIRPDSLIDTSHEALIRNWDKICSADGWLAREFRDGLIWRSLLVQAESFEHDSANVLSPATTRERERWVAQRNAEWAKRYDSGWSRVEALITASVAAARASEALRRRRARVLNIIAGVVVILLAAFVAVVQRQRNQAYAAVAELLWDRLDFKSDATAGGVPNGPALNSLWQIRAASGGQRQAFLEELTPRPQHKDDLHDRLVRLGQRPAVILRAARVDWAYANGDTRWADDVRKELLKEIPIERNSPNLVALVTALQALPGPLGADEARVPYDALLREIAQSEISADFLGEQWLLQALPPGTAAMTADQAKAEVETLHIKIEGSGDVLQSRALLKALAGRLTDDDREHYIADVLNKAKDAADDARHRLAVELDALLRDDDPRRMQADVAMTLLWASQSWSLPDYKAATDKVAALVKSDDPLRALNGCLQVVDETPSPFVQSYKPVISAIAGKVERSQVPAALTQVRAASGKTSKVATQQQDVLAAAAGVLASSLLDADAQAEVGRSLGLLNDPKLDDASLTERNQIPAVAAVVGALADKLTPDQAGTAAVRLLDLAEDPDPIVREGIARVLAHIAPRFTPKTAAAAATRLVTLLQDRRTARDTTAAVASALRASIDRLDPADASAVLDSLLKGIKSTDKTIDNIQTLVGMSSAVERLAAKAQSPNAQHVMKSLLGWSGFPSLSAAAARAWAAHTPRSSAPAFVRDVVEVLRYPTAAEATDELFAAIVSVVPEAAQLKERDERLKWLAHYPGVDLDSAVKCPEPGSVVADLQTAGLTCPER
jgi:hypothetical protein